MDALTHLVERIRSTGALLGTNLLTPPWRIRLDEGATMTVVTMLRGSAWLEAGDAPPRHLAPRDLAVVTGERPFSVTSDPSSLAPPQYVGIADGRCTDASGAVLPDAEISLGLRTCGDRLDAEHALFTGSFAATGRLTRRLLGGLPRVLMVPRERQGRAPMDLLEAELLRDEPGQQAVLDRLLDLVLIGALRDGLSRPGAAEDGGAVPPWFSATADPVVGPALEVIHDRPELPHTVASLADRAQSSRAAFARRFRELLGESPIAYLTAWRLCLAADLLRESEDTLEVIARRVGYSSAFALSTAFQREHGQRPSAYRAEAISA
ncbi:AraC family transcriptional regulator [Brachybacterium sp. YJGR34]|uniref:AraC family transcriptional regulator n=1 Tax=Brachybacterium sp. YJGR34 TaxID=2059911 RepID=UPI000E09E09F|nr:AraC family transcriptional regulator [Brachybacterium sp. YJGR34]